MARREVKVPTGELRTIEVPDDWSDEKFSEEMKKAFPPGGQYNQAQPEETPQQETPSAQPQDQNAPSNFGQSLTKPASFGQSLKEVGADAIDLLRNSLAAVKKQAVNAPSNIKKGIEDLEKHPVTGQFHRLGQMGAGAAESAKGIINAPHDFAEYLSKKNIPGLSAVENAKIPFTKDWKLKDLIPHIPEDTGVEKALGLEAQPERGDELTRAIPDILSLGAGGVSGIKALGKALSKPSESTLVARAIDDKIDAFAEKHSLDKKETKALKASLKKEYSALHGERVGELTPEGQEVAINIKKKEIAEKEPLTQIPEKEVGEIPPPPDTHAIIEEQRAHTERARERVERLVGTHDNPGHQSGPVVQEAIKDLKGSATDLYNSARDHYVDENVRADNTAEIRSVTRELDALKNSDELAPGYGSGTETQVALENRLQTLRGETVAASDIYELYRSLEIMAKNARKRQFSEGSGLPENERNAARDLAQRLDEQADRLATQLEQVGGQDVRSMIREANHSWRIYKHLKRNPVGRSAINTGFLPSNTLTEIAKTGTANEFLRALIGNSPELEKHVLAAYVGENGVKRLTKPNNLVQQYLNDTEFSEIQDAVNHLRESLTSGRRNARTQARDEQKRYDDLVDAIKEEAQNQKIRQDAIKDTAELNKQIEFHKAAIPKLQKRIDIEEANGRSSVSLQKEKKQHERDMQDKKGKLKKLARLILSIKGIQGFSKKFGL